MVMHPGDLAVVMAVYGTMWQYIVLLAVVVKAEQSWSRTAISQPTRSSPSTCAAPRTTTYSAWSYTVETTTRYATPLPSPLIFTTTYAPAFSDAAGLLPSNLTYTTYSLDRNATALQDGTYGQGAYARLWSTLSYNTTVPFTTTVYPTPVASSELIYPPPLYTACPSSADTCLDCYKLPANFIWGVAGSAWQIEGGLTSAGRGPSDLDTTGALPNTAGEADAEVTDMHYWLYKQDIARLAAIGVPYYSFSISWTRIVPFGEEGSPINTEGLEHYEDVIETCLEYGITPIVTLLHFDTPAGIGYSDPRWADAFLYYTKQVMSRYGDRVGHWVTINEPNLIFGLAAGADYSPATNILMGHARVYHWYKEVLGGTGLISLKFGHNLGLPFTTAPENVQSANRYQDFLVGVLAAPLLLGKNYPDDVLDTAGANLTALTDQQLAYVNGTLDYVGLDAYTAQYALAPPHGIDACAANISDANWPVCVVNTNVQQDGWVMGQASNAYAYIAPQYVRQQLGFIWNIYRPKAILISEFGFNPFDASLETVVAQRYDLQRTLYYQEFLREVLKSVHEDGVNVIGALAWSFVDNNEFGSFANQYGLQHLNRTDDSFTRTYKRSFFDFVDFFRQYVGEMVG